MRILVVSESFLPQVNGVTNSVRRVLDHLARTGHEAALVAPTGPSSYAGFPVHIARGTALPFYKDFRIGLETRRWLRSVIAGFRPDVVHVASPATLGMQAVRAATDLGVPVLGVYQTDLIGFADRYGIAGGGAAMASLTRRIHRRCDLTLAPSTASLEQLRALGIPDVALWGRGVDTELFHPAMRSASLRSAWAPGGEFIVGYVGRLAPEKELHLLARLDRRDDVRVVVVGGGPEESRLRGALPNAHFAGVLHGAELATAYASLDVFAHTGRFETFCQSAQEALASGVPCVVPDAGGPRDLVSSGVNGFRYPAGDGGALAAYVNTLQLDRDLHAGCARMARAGVEGRTWPAINEQLLAHYRSLRGALPVAA